MISVNLNEILKTVYITSVFLVISDVFLYKGSTFNDIYPFIVIDMNRLLLFWPNI